LELLLATLWVSHKQQRHDTRSCPCSGRLGKSYPQPNHHHSQRQAESGRGCAAKQVGANGAVDRGAKGAVWALASQSTVVELNQIQETSEAEKSLHVSAKAPGTGLAMDRQPYLKAKR
jgi:hypothetical protein